MKLILIPALLGLAFAWPVQTPAQAPAPAPARPAPVAPLSPAVPVVPAVKLVPATSLAPPQPPTNAAPAVADPRPPAAAPTPPAPPPPPPPPSPDSLAGALSKMSFDRSPDALLEAVASQRAGGKLTEAARFRLAVLMGDWPQVGAALKTLPAKDATKAYSRLLESLATNSLSAAQLFVQSRANNNAASSSSGASSGRSQERDKRALLLSDDFYAVIAAAPAHLGADHLDALATLVKVAIGPGGRQVFLTRLKDGLQGVGGNTPAGHKLAAQLLSAVGWMTDAGPYLPLTREAWADADTLSLVLTLEYFTQAGVENRDERQLQRAAEVCAFMMQTSRFGAQEQGVFKQATERFIKFLPALEAGDAEQLIREYFLTQPVLLVDLLLAVGESGQQALRGTDLKVREQSLATQNLLLRVVQGKKSSLPEAVNLLVMNWLAEAEQTYRLGGTGAAGNVDSDGFVFFRSSSSSSRREPRAIAADVILAQTPSPALVRRLNPGLAQRVDLTLLKVRLLDPKEPATLETLRDYLKDHPGHEKELCQDYLTAWVRKRTVIAEDPNIARLRLLGYNVPKPQAAGIPLTRLRQNQNVQDLKALLAGLRPLSPEPIDANTVVQGFMSVHSGAEVYRMEDVAAIFGPPEAMNHAELMALITGMRGKLREQWRDPTQQAEAGTNRSEGETKDEVSRGYRTAIQLAQRGLRPEKSDWKEFIVRGQLFFDTAEFEFARQVKLTEYVDLREEAFGSYRKAAELYAAKVPDMPRGQRTTEPYQMWFLVMLGASDLSQLTRAAARSDPGLKQIGEAMRALPGEAAEGHLEKFGEMLGATLSQVPANMKQRFLSAGLQVVGEKHPSARAAREALEGYQTLLDEAQLRLTVDGPTRVGHGQPFGVFLGLEHTRQLARESGGFAKYIQSPNNQSRSFFLSASTRQINHREEFTKNIHAALDETFTVSSITFLDPNAKPLDLPREGWQETPFAYLVLRPKDAAVDRIPSLQLDMEFSDQAGQVMLPVRSQVQPIDARDADAGPRPCEALSLNFTLDEREWRQGKLVVEIAARGQGIIPSHTDLMDFAQPGFDTEVTDNGLSITQVESDGRRKTVKADRSWQLTYQRKKDLRGDVTFHFPALKPAVTNATVEYKHYEDADLVAITPAQAAAGVRLRSPGGSGLRVALVGAGAVAVGAVAWLLRRRRRQEAPQVHGALALPAQITPFSVVAFLRRIQHDAGSGLDEPARAALQAQIRQIEGAFFRGTPSLPAPSTSELETIARTWQRSLP